MSIRKAAFDTIAMSFVNVLRLLAQFLAVPILSRILSPSDYGVVAMAMPFVLFAMMIADAGIGMSLVRTPANERSVWSTCFWLSVMLGAGLAGIMAMFAPISSLMFAEPRLGPIVMALAAVVFIQSITSISGAALQQELRFRLIACIEVSAVMTSIAIAVITARHGGGAWGLVLQQLAFYGVRCLLTLWFSPFRPQTVFDIAGVKDHLLFGRDVLGVNIIGFFTRSIDNLVIGKMLNAAAVGVYSMAFQFARLPMMVVSGPLQYVFYSRLSRVKDDIAAVRRTFLILTRILATLIFPAMGMIAIAWHPLFTLLLSAKWAASGRIFMLVAAVTSLQAVTALCGTIRMVLGRTDYQFKVALETAVIWAVALLAAAPFGLDRIAVTYSAVFLLYAPRSLMLALPLIDCPASAYIRAIIAPLTVTLVGIAIFYELRSAFQLDDFMQMLLVAIMIIITIISSAGLQLDVFKSELISAQNRPPDSA